VCTIHQPQSKIFHLFDQLLLLQAGCMVYQGPAAGALTHFAQMGFPCPGEPPGSAAAPTRLDQSHVFLA
jgi:ABC-type multidrug transport system ATPase subunit